MEELLENLIPLYNKEFYLACLCGENVVLPIPDGNAERYLAYLCGMDVTIPDVPDGRTETYLAYKCGEDVVLPDPMYRIEFYLAKWCGMDVEVPEPLYRIEYWLAQLANSGELKTVTGNPISISDALAKPAEALTIEILPQQDLHGYSNPWPAGGGVNKANPEEFTPTAQTYGLTTTISGDVFTIAGTYTNTTSTASFRIAKRYVEEVWTAIDYSLKAFPTDADGQTHIQRLGTADSNKVLTIALKDMVENTQYNIQFKLMGYIGTAPSTWTPYENLCPISGFTGVNIYHESAYDPDADPTYSISWQDEAGTVYGGELDVTNGVLTVTKESLVFDSSAWSFSSNFFYKANTVEVGKNVSNNYTTENGIKMYLNSNNGQARIYLADNGFLTSESDVGSMLNGYKLLYELATPLTIQLTPTEIQMLLGNNTIWNDVGDMVLEYLADGPADDVDALNILLGNRYVNNGAEDEATDKEALEILLGGNAR